MSRPKGTYRFFYHYNKQRKMWSVHYRGRCYICDYFVCLPSTEGKKNRRQPYRVAQGWSYGVNVGEDGTVLIY